MAKKLPRHELYEEVLRLRKGGLSFGKIGKRLGFSRQRAHALLKAGPPSTAASTGTSTAASTRLTLRQRKFALGLAQGLSQKDAALQAVPPGSIKPESAEKWASLQVGDPRFRQAFAEILARAGASPADFAQAHADALRADRTVTVGKGKDREVLREPDHRTRLRAAELGYKVLGVLPGTENNLVEADFAAINITVTPEQAKRLEIFRRPAPGQGGEVINVEPDDPEK